MSCCNSSSEHAYAAPSGKLDAPRRNHYYFSKMMDVLQFEMEQSYGNGKRWLLNRLSLGTGVLCGLNVKKDGAYLCVTPGVAIDTFGHEVIVPGRYCLDPWLLPDECGRPTRELPRDKAHKVTLCLGYRECLADQAPVLVTDCRSEQLCEAGSVVESFNLWVHEGWPKSEPGLCEALNDATGTAGYQVVATIDVGGRPLGVAVAANGKRALVINEAAAPMLQVLDVATNTVVHTFSNLVTAPLGGVSIAPDGGRIFVTHADGVTVVDLEAATPKAEALFREVPYGACAASHGGARLYAINTKKKTVDRIDTATNHVTPVKPAKKPTDLAVSSDSSVLFVADADSKTLYAIDTSTDTLRYTESTDRPTRTLATAGKAGAIDAWSAHEAGGARRFDDNGIAGDVTFNANAGDSAFTSDGNRYYVTHRGGDAAGEVVVLSRTDAKEIARLPVGKAPIGIAVVPGRLRGLVANADSGTVTVIDVVGLRERLCRVLLGPCPDPEDKPCIELATVELLPDGTIGKVDVCTHRVRLLSNEKLLELILCLADKLEECCGGHVPPPKEPPPPVVKLLKVTGVEFFDLRGNTIVMQHPDQITTFKEADNFNRIRLTFDRPVDLSTITTGPIGQDPKTFSLLVTANWSTGPLKAVGGTVALAAPNAVDYTIGLQPRTFIGGEYKLELFGDIDPGGLRPIAKGTDGSVLDGEPNAFPTGNGTPGGDFSIKFISVPQ